MDRVKFEFGFITTWTNGTTLHPEWFAQPSISDAWKSYRVISDQPIEPNAGFRCAPVTVVATNAEAIPYPIGIEIAATGTKPFRQYDFLALEHGTGEPTILFANSPFKFADQPKK
ncbi:MAG TPA: hypothetical protein VMP11_15285 [Verrucomicrobiae bacterium]|nr:hypothetical protein [Verrucomicrobiae bacterium]